MEALNVVLGGEIGALPTSYLGIPLGAKSQSYKIWNNVVERCEMKLARWKSQFLSRDGSGKEAWRSGNKNLMNQSKALKMKWLWKFNNEEQSYWKKVI
ncbi:hypothetical protein H5410_011598 [Solanum commersonii]|uniref:Uncharacterized protein n=1 Tax=Solanum commersonii TaxID=4109 RepID=A0A9J6APU4_SOLCO|nr:hypothetical protein H5410_011598 [Solanum commersonii]